MEQRVAKLEQDLKQVTEVLTKFMSVPYRKQKELMDRLMPLLEIYERKEGPFAAKKKPKRRRLNHEDWTTVQGYLNDDGEVASWRSLAKVVGIAETTVRKYAKMTPEEVAELPPTPYPEEIDDGEASDEV